MRVWCRAERRNERCVLVSSGVPEKEPTPAGLMGSGVRYGTRAEGPDGDGKPDGYLFSNTRGQGFGQEAEPLSSGI
jgi:hypothetical protein